MASTTACNFVGGENVMRQRKMCKAANESDLLVVVHTYYTNRFSRMNLLNMAKGPFFGLRPLLFLFRRRNFSWTLAFGRSVGDDVTHIYSDHRGKGRQNFSSPAFVWP